MRERSRLGASEVIGSILLMGITLAVGFAVWAWASNAAVASERSFGNAVNTNIGCINLNYIIVNANFSATTGKLITVWFYNNGHGAVNITNIILSNTTWAYTYGLAVSNSNLTGRLLTQNVKSLTINIGTNLSPNKLYSFQSGARNESYTKTGSTGYWSYQCGTLSPLYQQVTPNTIPV